MTNRPRVAITMGDAAGIGPETTVKSLADLHELLKTHKVGDTLTVTVQRDGEKVDEQVTLTELN